MLATMASACRRTRDDTLQHVPSTISIRVAARRIAILRADAQSRNRGRVVGHISRTNALQNDELPESLAALLDPGEQMQVRIALNRWRQEQENKQRQEQLANAVTELERITAVFNSDQSLTGSDLMAAVEQYRLRAAITAWEALGIALRDRARRYGANDLVPLIKIKQFSDDDDPVVIASDQSDTQTLHEEDVNRLRDE